MHTFVTCEVVTPLTHRATSLLHFVYPCHHMSGAAKPEVRGTGEPLGGAYAPPGPPLVRHHDTHHYLIVDGRAETDRLTLFASDTLAHHFEAV